MDSAKEQNKSFRLPTVQLIGAQKAGTSAIADWLFDEGRFCRPKVFDDEPWYYSKEVHFFDSEQRYEQGLEFYSKRFQDANRNCCRRASDVDIDRIVERTMDATPDTLPFAERVRNTYETAGGNQASSVKIIVILREPVSRELSLYNHLAFDCRHLGDPERTSWHTQVMKEDDGTIMTFEEFVSTRSIPALQREAGPGRSTRHGLYASHLSKWFELFDRQQILVLSYEELQHNPEKLQKRIQSFLGFEIDGRLHRSNTNDSQYKIQSPSHEASEALNAVFGPLNEKLYKLLESHQGPPMEQRPFPRFQG